MGHQLDPLARQAVSGPLDLGSQGQHDVRRQLEAEVVGQRRPHFVQHRPSRMLEADQHFGGGDGQPLADAHKKRHARPTLGLDVELDGRVGLDLRVGGDAGLLAIAAKLAADDVGGGQRPDRSQQPPTLVSQFLVFGTGGAGHRQAGDDLEHVILHDVADRSHFVIKLSPPLHPELLGHGDLDALQVVAVPAGLDQRIGEAEVDQVQHRFLAEVMIDAKDGRLGKEAMKRAIQFLGRGQIAAEGLFHHHPRILRAADLGQPFRDRGEHVGRNRQIVQRPFDVAQRLTQLRKSGRIAVVAVDVLQQRAELRVCRGVQAAVLGETLLDPRLELVEVPARFRHCDDRHVEMPVTEHRLQRGKDLLVGQIARGAEKDNGIRLRDVHGEPPAAAPGFSTCPPNSDRIAESSLSAKSASPRELKRS